MGAIITHGSYICYRCCFSRPFLCFQGVFFLENSVICMINIQERVVIKSGLIMILMTRVLYFLRFCWFYVGLSDQCAHALETRWMNARQQLTQGRGPSIKYFFAIFDTPRVHFSTFLYLCVLTFPPILGPLPLKKFLTYFMDGPKEWSSDSGPLCDPNSRQNDATKRFPHFNSNSVSQ